jgi:hypothetical protein
MTFCHHVSAASAGIRCKYRNNADNPFILPSTLITLQPFLLAADLAVKLHVDGRRLHADLRASGAQDRRRLGFLVGPERALSGRAQTQPLIGAMRGFKTSHFES